MPHYYLSNFIGTGEGDDAYRPPTTQPYGLIDLRGDPTKQDGHSLLVVDDLLSPQPGVHKLADNLDEPLTSQSLAAIRSRLGVTLQPGTLRAGIVELMLRHATPANDKARWNRLQTNHRRRHRIVLGGEVVYDAPDIQNSIVTDDFNRADEDLEASPNWSVSDVDSSFVISSNRLSVNSIAGRRNGWWSPTVFGPDCYVQLQYVSLGGEDHGPILRYDGADPDSSNLYMARDDQPRYDIAKFVNGPFTRLASGGTAVTGTWRFEADGSTLTLRNNTTTVLTVTDTSHTGAGFCGMTAFHAAGQQAGGWDDFEAADLPPIWVDDKVAYVKLEPSVANPL